MTFEVIRGGLHDGLSRPAESGDPLLPESGDLAQVSLLFCLAVTRAKAGDGRLDGGDIGLLFHLGLGRLGVGHEGGGKLLEEFLVDAEDGPMEGLEPTECWPRGQVLDGPIDRCVHGRSELGGSVSRRDGLAQQPHPTAGLLAQVAQG